MLRGDPEANNTMEIDHLSFTLPACDDRVIDIQAATTRSVDRSSQLLVVEIPANAIEGTVLMERLGIEHGASVAVRTAAGRTYEGYVEIVAESATGRLYWCGLGF